MHRHARSEQCSPEARLDALRRPNARRAAINHLAQQFWPMETYDSTKIVHSYAMTTMRSQTRRCWPKNYWDALHLYSVNHRDVRYLPWSIEDQRRYFFSSNGHRGPGIRLVGGGPFWTARGKVLPLGSDRGPTPPENSATRPGTGLRRLEGEVNVSNCPGRPLSRAAT